MAGAHRVAVVAASLLHYTAFGGSVVVAANGGSFDFDVYLPAWLKLLLNKQSNINNQIDS